MAGLTLDTGALIALERGDRRAWGLLRLNDEREGTLSIPAGCLAQFWRRNHPRVARLLGAAVVDPLDHPAALSVGRLLASSGTADPIDASVVLVAAARRQAVLTSDPSDIERIAEAGGFNLRVLRV